MTYIKLTSLTLMTLAVSLTFTYGSAAAQPAAQSSEKKPNIVIIWGDDIGQSNISTYSKGVMGYRTPNIDRIANEGITFTDYYGEQSCTAGRSAFITGQSVFRTGLSKWACRAPIRACAEQRQQIPDDIQGLSAPPESG